MFRAHAIAEIPRVGVLVAANFQYLSGKPWAANAFVRLPQGPRPILVEPPGSRRLPAQTLLDVRVSKSFSFQGGRKLELLVDILNALNKTTPERVISTNLFSPNFGKERSPIYPRRAMVGVKVVF